jgi:hypothetical protein
MGFRFLRTFVLFFLALVVTGHSGIAAIPFRGCAPALLSLSQTYRQRGHLPEEVGMVLNSNETTTAKPYVYDFASTAFYEPLALYIGIKAIPLHPRGIHFFTVAGHQRLDGYRRGISLTTLREGIVPSAAYGLLFKLAVTPESLAGAEAAMEKYAKGENPGDCVSPVLAVLDGAGIVVPGLDRRMNIKGISQTIVEGLVFHELLLDDKPLGVSVLATDHDALDWLANYWVKREALVYRQLSEGRIWDPAAGNEDPLEKVDQSGSIEKNSFGI